MDVCTVGIVIVVIVVITVRSARVRGGRLGAMAVRWWRRFVSLTFVLAHGAAKMIVTTCKLKGNNNLITSYLYLFLKGEKKLKNIILSSYTISERNLIYLYYSIKRKFPIIFHII